MKTVKNFRYNSEVETKDENLKFRYNSEANLR